MSRTEGRRAEHDLLITAVRVALGTADATRLEDVLDRDIDWSFCTDEAVRHGVVSLLCDALEQVDTAGTVPDDRREWLEEHRQTTIRRNIRLTGELVQLLDRFDDAAVDVLPFKGPMMAVKAYDDLTARTFVDLDLLVRPDAFLDAKQVLRAAGYREQSAQTPTHAKVNRKYGKDAIFSDDGLTVELHQRLLPYRFGRGVRIDRLFERATSVDVAGTTVPTAPPAETLVMAAVHGTKHRWSRLEWLCGIAGLLDRAAIDWERVTAEAAAVGKTRMLAITLSLARDVLDASLPQQGHRIIESDGQVQDLHERLTGSLLDRSNSTPIRNLLFQSRSLDSSSDQLRFWVQFLYGLQPADVDFLHLSPWLTRGYHVVRPVRLALAVGQLGAERLSR